MKILHILDHSVPLFSGYSFRSQSILLAQKALMLVPVVLTSPKHGSEYDEVEEIDGIRFYRTKTLNDNFTSRAPFVREANFIRRFARRLQEVAEAEKVQLIHSHSPSLNGLAALRVARRLRVPLVYEARSFWEDAAVHNGTFQERSLRYRISRGVESFLFEKADTVVTICDGMRQDLIARGVGAERIHVIPNGVDVGWFQPRPRDTALAEQFELNGKPVFGFAGSFYRYEGLRFLLDSLPQLTQSLPGAKVILMGGGYDEPFIRDKARLYPDTVILPGQVPHERMRDFYSIIDVFLCPRERIRLTDLVTPLKPLEAMSMAKTVLASDVGGHRELIQHDKTGLLFQAENRDDFLRQAVRAAREPSFRQTVGENARRFVEGERAWPKIVSRYVGVYEELARTKRRVA